MHHKRLPFARNYAGLWMFKDALNPQHQHQHSADGKWLYIVPGGLQLADLPRSDSYDKVTNY